MSCPCDGKAIQDVCKECIYERKELDSGLRTDFGDRRCGGHRRPGAHRLRQPQEHGLLHRLLPAGHRRGPGAPQLRQCTVHPAGDHRHRGGRNGRGPGCQGVPGQGRLLPRLPFRAGDVRDDRCSGVPGLPPADGDPPGRRRPDRRGRPGGLRRRHPGGRGVPEEGFLPGPGLPRPDGRGLRPAGDHGRPAGTAAVGAHPAEVL